LNKMGKFTLCNCEEFASAPPRHRLNSYPNDLFAARVAAAAASSSSGGVVKSKKSPKSPTKNNQFCFNRISDVPEDHVTQVREKFLLSKPIASVVYPETIVVKSSPTKQTTKNKNVEHPKVLTQSVAFCSTAARVAKRVYRSKIMGLEDSKGFLKVVSIGFFILCTRFFVFRH